MEKEFLDNLLVIIKADTLIWKMLEKSTFEGDNEFIISSIGPDNKTKLKIKFTDDKINYLKVTNSDLKIDNLLFRTKFPEQLGAIGPILYKKFKNDFEELNKKIEMSEDEKWSKLSQTFDLQTVRDEKLNKILDK